MSQPPVDNTQGGEPPLSDIDEKAIMLEIRELMNRVYALMEMLRRRRRNIQVKQTPLSPPEQVSIYTGYSVDFHILDLLGVVKGMCGGFSNPLDVHEIAQCLNSIKDLNTRVFAFQVLTAAILRYPYVTPLIAPYDPRCKLKSFEVTDAPATESDENADGITWTAIAECPKPGGGVEERVFTGEILYSALMMYSPAQREANVGTQNTYYFNVVRFGPVVPFNISVEDFGANSNEEGGEE
ncbi:MAG: hypothetical protein L7G96_07020 [Vulcanisaeta sp.]|nr:hypothetical protein [Vulcanisaeta sp.]